MRVCLVRCPSPFLIDERSFPPLGLMSVGAGLREQGHLVAIHDGDLKDIPLDYDYYGFGPTSPEYPSALETMQRLKLRVPAPRVIVGGAHVTLNHATCMKDGWDCIVVGDGEYAAEEAFLSPAELIVAPSLPLDKYPFPDRSLVDLSRYTFAMRGFAATTIMGSRGCPFHCGFCCKNNTNVRLQSAARMIEEIGVVEKLGFKAIAFPEDIFILNRRRTEEVCAYLKDRGLVWRCLVRADLVVKYGMSFLKMMSDSGCVGVGIGIESGSERILKIIGKGEPLSVMKQAVAMLKEAGIYVKGFFIVGLPGENAESLDETDRFLDEVQLDDIDCKIFQPYPGSPIYDHRECYDISWNGTPLKDTFYKGRPGDYHGSIATSSLTTKQIIESWKYLEGKYKRWDNPLGAPK